MSKKLQIVENKRNLPEMEYECLACGFKETDYFMIRDHMTSKHVKEVKLK